MAQPGATSRIVLAVVWIPVGLAMFAVPGWLWLTRSDVLLNSHPAGLATVLACAALGGVALIWAGATLALGGRYDAQGDPDHLRHRNAHQLQRRAVVRLAFGIPAMALCLLLMGWLVYARPYAATPVAIAALQEDERIKVPERLTWYEMVPHRKTAAGDVIKPRTGLVFIQGARVDPRAYAHLLRPLVDAGYLVIVLKEPFNLALPTSGHAARVMALHPEIRYWAVGGHSLGGVAAAAFADSHPEVDGLLLYASYPGAAMKRHDLKATSIFGSADRFTTPADVAASRATLPKGTGFQVVKGAVHSYFGDYGSQAGEGSPTVSRSAAQAQIIRGTMALLASLPTAPKRPK